LAVAALVERHKLLAIMELLEEVEEQAHLAFGCLLIKPLLPLEEAHQLLEVLLALMVLAL
jgi:hypothetical protein